MNTVSAVKKQNLIKINHKKKKIQRNRKIIAIGILLLTLFIIGTSIKNMYVSYRCSNFLYSVDYYFTHWKDKSLRLIEVESMSVISKVDNKIEIEAYGFAYEKPYKKTYLIGTFIEDDKGHWHMESVRLKDDQALPNTDTEENIISE
ncbi:MULTISPECIES: hypothetical protein [unclassified Clostridium]|uniref:hypothetical protein n=1 Tax=unclassified Clostridium TaxID=2614128 RepID=UPI00189BE3BD|nr:MULTISPECIES: hypothetical protein [unclassified Clostridium]MBP3917526.1 hypothetical protein [Clostridium sp.]MEE0933577.1 hypothetical protein [Clostridium sp.]